MVSLSFRIPEQLPPGSDSFDTSPAAVQRWVAELPMGHLGNAAKHLYAMLREVNRLEIPLTERFDLMETVAEPLQAVLDTLERHYTGMTFPLPSKSLRVAQLSVGLLQEVVIAYQSVLNGEEDASWLFRKTHLRLWAETVHRLVYHLHAILRTYQLLHRPAPQGVWLATHRLYWMARENRRACDRVKGVISGGTESIEAEYLESLLLSLVEPQLFSRAQMGQVMANMPLWRQHCDLLDGGAVDAAVSTFCIRRDVDSPYTLFAERCSSDSSALLFDISGLSRFVAGLIEQIGEDDSITPPGGSEISRDTLELLRDCWKVHDEGREERPATNLEVEVAASMSGIFKLLQGGVDATARGISDQSMRDDLEELHLLHESEEQERHNMGTVIGKRQEEDVWSTIFAATEMTQKNWSREVDEQEYRFIHAYARNVTDSGMCLEFNHDEVDPFQVGELMGVKSAAAEGVQLCMVRWLTDSSKRLTTGLMQLAQSVEPVLVLLHNESQRTALYCLLGIGRDQRPQLFLPHLPVIRKRELYMVVDSKEVPVTLGERVVLSPLFDAYHFNVGLVNFEEETSLQVVNRQLHDLTHPQKQEEKESGDFADLWDSL